MVTPERPGARLISLFLRWGGPQMCYLGAPFVVLLYFLTGHKERRAVANFHSTIVPMGRAKGLLQPLFLAYVNFLRFAFSMIDRLFALRHGRVPPMRLETAFDLHLLDNGAVFLGAHFGDWALCGQVFSKGASEGRRINVVMDLGANPAFTAQAGNLAEMGAKVIDASRGTVGLLLDVKQALDNREIVCFLADRGPREARNACVPFFGRDADWHLGPFEIAARFGKPLVGFFCIKEGLTPSSLHVVSLEALWDGREPLGATPGARPEPERLLRRYVALLETRVARSPTHWFNFFPFWNTIEGNGRNES